MSTHPISMPLSAALSALLLISGLSELASCARHVSAAPPEVVPFDIEKGWTAIPRDSHSWWVYTKGDASELRAEHALGCGICRVSDPIQVRIVERLGK